MSHLVNMVERESSHIDRIKRAHMILEMENESTAEVLIWNDPESVERLFDRIRSLVSSICATEDPEIGTNEYNFKRRREHFVEGLDDFVVDVFCGLHSVGFVDVTRNMLHNAWMFLEERDKNDS